MKMPVLCSPFNLFMLQFLKKQSSRFLILLTITRNFTITLQNIRKVVNSILIYISTLNTLPTMLSPAMFKATAHINWLTYNLHFSNSVMRHKLDFL